MQISSKFRAAPPTQNPFASASASNNETASNPFTLTQKPNTFGAPSAPISSAYVTPSTSSGLTAWSKAIKTSSNNSQKPYFNPFAGANNAPNNAPNNVFGSVSDSSKSSLPKNESPNIVSHTNSSFPATFSQGVASYQNISESLNTSSLRSRIDDSEEPSKSSTRTSSTPSDTQSSSFADKIELHLRTEKIITPSLSALDYDKELTEFLKSATDLRKEFLIYREKVRTSLIKANLLDDPNVPKKLKDAIDFKGTCDRMCPEYECLTRMVDRRYDKTEKDLRPDGTLSNLPNPSKMVKALARAAAGQDAPLPSDIRTAAALRRTIDYLFKTLLAERELETIHGFLWDRTRAVRRDFVFHSSMTPPELVDQVYCLERIVRFHAISLHHMSKDGISSDGFSDQQEREQLSKSLLSLIHAYEDCRLQGVHCENEIEFKAYYVLFNGEIPGIMSIVQSWGWEIWENYEIIRIAVSLSESLQNTWDVHGPLYPASTSEIGQNAFSKFFSIVEDSNVSYTMACFAEIYFNKIRKGILRTILTSYRKQRSQTKDWTAERLNQFLRFDNEAEIEPFLELYGIQFSETDGERYLSFNSASNIQDPHPLPRQSHSYHLVEKKRGRTSLSDAINYNVYEKITLKSNDTLSLFVEDNQGGVNPPSKLFTIEGQLGADQRMDFDSQQGILSFGNEKSSSISETAVNSFSLFNHLGPQKSPAQTLQPGLCSVSASNDLSLLDKNSSSVPEKVPKTDSLSLFSQHDNTKINSNNPSIFNFPKSITKNPSNSLGLSTFSTNPSNTIDSKPDNLMKISKTCEDQSEAFSEDSKSNSFSQPFNFTSSNAQSSTSSKKKVNWSAPMNYYQIPPDPAPSHPENPPTPSHPTFLSTDKTSAVPPNNLLDHQIIQTKTNQYNVTQNDRPSRLDCLTNWIVNGQFGLLQQFFEHQACKIVHDTFKVFASHQKIQALKEAEKRALMEAKTFRWRSLAVKYGYCWREQARNLRLRRERREAREARRLMAKNSKEEKAGPSASFIEDLNSSVALRRRPRDSMESPLDEAEAQLSKSDFQSDSLPTEHADGPLQKRQCSERSTISENSSMNRQDRFTSGKLRSPSLLSDPSFLSGESRIHLISRHSNKNEKKKQASGVQTDYFRLKARGIVTLPRGTRLP
ncbi:hypothetical protein K3495_g5306 [Podosphaera aphanis]|nr:hypothetical protein K3495_g5306 [Podosphaera aphanis]